MPEYLQPLDLVQVVGRWSVMSQGGLDSDGVGRAAVGNVVFKPSTTLVIQSTGEIVMPVSFSATLDAEGRINIMLPATNDPDVTPTGWVYEVNENIEGKVLRSYTLAIDYNETVVDLKDAALGGENANIVILRSTRGVPGGVAALDNVGRVMDWEGKILYNKEEVDSLLSSSGSAAQVAFTAGGNITATNVQAAVEELDAEKSEIGHDHDGSYETLGHNHDGTYEPVGSVAAHGHTATQTTYTPTGNIAATNVQNAITELDTEKAPATHTHVQYPSAVGQPTNRIAQTDGADGWVFIETPAGGGGGGTDDQVAAEVPYTPTGNITATNVQTAINQLDGIKAQKATAPIQVLSADRMVSAADMGTTMMSDGWAVTIPNDTTDNLPVGAFFVVRQDGGAVTIAAEAGVVVEPIMQSLNEDGSTALFQKISANRWAQDGPNDDSATTITVTPAGSITSTNVQDALVELDTNKSVVGHGHSVAASGVSFTPTGAVAATNVQNAIAEVDTEKVAKASFPVVLTYAISDETTVLTTGAAKLTVRAPFAFTLTGVRASVNVASTSGLPTFDINEAGVSFLSTKLTIDANEKTSVTAATAAVISDTAIADDAELTFDVDVAGTGTKGAKITILGFRSV